MAQLLVVGLAMGCIYALIALGFVLIFDATGAVNFAQGDIVMLGGFIIVWMVQDTKMPALLILVVAIVAMIAIGIFFERIAFYPLRHKPLVTVFISTIGMGIALRNLAQLIWGPEPRTMPSTFGQQLLRLGSTAVPTQMVFIVAVTVVLLVAQWLFFSHTLTGRMMRATAQDPVAAQMVGVRIGRMTLMTFIISSLLAGSAGWLLAPVFFLTPDMGNMLILKAYIATTIGGFGNTLGAILGGIFLGMLEVLSAGYISSVYKDVITFAVVMLVLLIRPQGLLGEAIAEKV